MEPTAHELSDLISREWPKIKAEKDLLKRETLLLKLKEDAGKAKDNDIGTIYDAEHQALDQRGRWPTFFRSAAMFPVAGACVIGGILAFGGSYGSFSEAILQPLFLTTVASFVLSPVIGAFGVRNLEARTDEKIAEQQKVIQKQMRALDRDIDTEMSTMEQTLPFQTPEVRDEFRKAALYSLAKNPPAATLHSSAPTQPSNVAGVAAIASAAFLAGKFGR